MFLVATRPSIGSSLAGYRFLAAQVLLGLAALGCLLLKPPAEGAMLILPLASSGEGAAVRFARERDLALLGSGPVRGSVVVQGTRAQALAGAWSAGMLVTAAVGGCGQEPDA
jgi:hypothetical protein